MVSWKQFLYEFARAGNFTLGGGPPMIAELQRRIITERGWLPAEDFGLLYGVARLTPGTNILAFIAAMGTRIKGPLAGAIAVVAGSLPAATVIWLMTVFFNVWSANPWVAAALAGAMAAVVGLILSSAWQLFNTVRRFPIAIPLFGAALALGVTETVGPVTILLLAATAGALLSTKQ